MIAWLNEWLCIANVSDLTRLRRIALFALDDTKSLNAFVIDTTPIYTHLHDLKKTES